MESVFGWIASHGALGYAAIYLFLMAGIVGLPIPDETFLVFCGYLIFKRIMNPFIAWPVAVVGSWSGISLSYTIGRTLGLGVVHRYGKYLHVTEQRLNRVHQWFDRLGHWLLFFGYYIAGVRHFSAILAGTSGLPFRTFASYAWPGGLLWVTLFMTVGYYLGESWKEISALIEQYVLYISIGLLAIAVCYYFVKRRTRNVTKTGS